MSSTFTTSVSVEKLDEGEIPSQELLRQNLNDSVIEKAIRKRRSCKIIKDKFVYSCDICKKKFQEKDHYRYHLLIHSGVEECEICNSQFKCRKYLLRHIRNSHGEKRNKYKCDVCDKSFPFNARLQNHRRVHTGEKPHKCDVCGKCFNARYSLRTHMLIHTDDKPFECAFCEYKCRDSSTLRKHQHRHMGIEKIYQCKKCDKSYKSKFKLTMHNNQAHLKLDMKIYECNICNKKFSYQKVRNLHIRNVHERNKEGNCEICGQYLPNVANMSTHLLIHTEERPYKCTYETCDKRFKCKDAMKRHNIIHYPSKHISCPQCPSTFSRRTRLNYHLLKVHGRKLNVECDICNTKFYSEKYLAKHLDIVHKQVFRVECEYCGFCTNMKPALIKHLKAYHSHQDRTCELCNKEFKSVTYLKVHKARYHVSKEKISTLHEESVAGKLQEDEPIKIKEEMIDIEEHDLEEVLRKAEIVNGEDIKIPALQYENENNVIAQEKEEEKEEGIHTDLMEQESPLETVADEVICERDSTVDVKPKKSKIKDEKTEAQIKERAQRDINTQLAFARMKKAREALEQIRLDYNQTLIERAAKRKLEKESKTAEKTPKKLVLYKDKGASQEHTCASQENSSNVESDNCSETVTGIREPDDGKNSKIKFKTTQCYVCFKLFENKEKLIEHCQEHFEICNKKLLKKCPFCPYVTSAHLPRHVSLVHNVKIRTAYGRLIKKGELKYVVGIQDKVFQENDTDTARDVDEIDIIPSVVNLNRQEYLKIDKKNRELKSKETLKSTLVKKGDEWVVSQEAVHINFEEYLLEEFDEASVRKIIVTSNDDYVERLIKLKVAAKRQGQKMLSPCDLCDKICSNMAALKAHRKSHIKRERVRRKPKVKDKIVKRKTEIRNEVKGTAPQSDANQNLMEFYKNNVEGTGVEFEQFVKIFHEINKVDDDNLEVLVHNEDFGLDFDGEAKRRSNRRVKCNVRS